MSLETLIVIAIAALLLLSGLSFAIVTSRPRKRDRRYVRDAGGNVVSIGGQRMGDATELRGDNVHTSPSAQLDAGKYVLSYELDVPTRVVLIAESDGEEETILISFGAGVKEFAVMLDGAYHWRIEPNVSNRPWRIVYHAVRRR
ncbi:MAG: hypothetical protein SGJ24_17705 [Chloroflexota bacterium]|nr:hypothetical protein [Chloroflexota bacterium]